MAAGVRRRELSHSQCIFVTNKIITEKTFGIFKNGEAFRSPNVAYVTYAVCVWRVSCESCERGRRGGRLGLGGDGLARVVDLHVLVVVGLVAGRLAADVAGEGPRAAVHLHVLGQVVAAVEGLAALGHLAHVLLGHLVLAHVSLAVVLADELAAAVVARVGPHRLVRVHV